MADVGYMRVSTEEQHTRRQLEGVHLDKVFTDKISGASAVRPALRECLNYLREGDTLHIHSLDRLARSLTNLKNIVAALTDKGVRVLFHKENLSFSPAGTTPLDTLLFHILGAFAEFERELIRTRQEEGIKAAKKQGVRLGRPPVDEATRAAIVDALNQKKLPRDIATMYSVSLTTVYRIRCKQIVSVHNQQK